MDLKYIYKHQNRNKTDDQRSSLYYNLKLSKEYFIPIEAIFLNTQWKLPDNPPSP